MNANSGAWGGQHRIFQESPLALVPGVSLDLFGVDLMHCWDLGAMQSYVAYVITFVLRSKIFSGGLAWLNMEDEMRIALNEIKSNMWAYYRRRRWRWR